MPKISTRHLEWNIGKLIKCGGLRFVMNDWKQLKDIISSHPRIRFKLLGLQTGFKNVIILILSSVFVMLGSFALAKPKIITQGKVLNLKPGDKGIVKMPILHPAQPVLGIWSARLKGLRFMGRREESPKDFVEYLSERPLPVVVGPDSRLYMLDHHHQLYALALIGEQYFFIEVVKNKSDLTMPEFWNYMKEKDYVYLYDQNDKLIAPEDIGDSVFELGDDIYRSLAGEVKDANGFVKVEIPFTEFQWARFYRNYFSPEALQKDFAKSVIEAVRIAHSSEARDLPGFVPQRPYCKQALRPPFSD